MPLVEFNPQPGLIPLRRFASLGLPLMLTVSAAGVWRAAALNLAFVLLALAVFAAVVGRWRPLWFGPLYTFATALGYPLMWLMSYLLLAAVYFFMITPIGLVLRLVRRDQLARRFDREAQSYWIARSARGDRQRYFRQY